MKRLMKKLSSLNNDIIDYIENGIKEIENGDLNEKDFKDGLDDLIPFPELSDGMGRYVYDMGDSVLKVAKTQSDEPGIISNNNEINLYNKANTTIKKYLAPITDHGYGWLIMKAFKEEVPENDQYIEKIFKMDEEFKHIGINPGDVVWSEDDINFDNVRLNGDNIIIIDYGAFH